MADTDLTKTIIPYLDRHLVFPLLNHLLETSLFPNEDVQRAQYELAKSTNMVDYAVALYGQVNGEDAEPPAGARCSPKHTPASSEPIAQSSRQRGIRLLKQTRG
jgi:translation initiation factor 3 subunit E